MTKGSTKVTRTSLVLSYLKKRSRSKLTTEQIATGINGTHKTKYTNKQIVECLSRFASDGMIRKMSQSGSPKALWSYNKIA